MLIKFKQRFVCLPICQLKTHTHTHIHMHSLHTLTNTAIPYTFVYPLLLPSLSLRFIRPVGCALRLPKVEVAVKKAAGLGCGLEGWVNCPCDSMWLGCVAAAAAAGVSANCANRRQFDLPFWLTHTHTHTALGLAIESSWEFLATLTEIQIWST